MKILHLLSSGGYYGKEAVIINLCAALEKLGCSTEVGAFLNSQAPNDEVVVRAQREGLAARTFDCRGRIDFDTVKRIREHIVAQPIDLVHTHDYKADLYGYLAARWTGRPVFATCHLWFGTTVGERIYGEVDRFVLRRFDGVIGVSPPIVGTLRKSWVAERKVAVIANGIELLFFVERRGRVVWTRVWFRPYHRHRRPAGPAEGSRLSVSGSPRSSGEVSRSPVRGNWGRSGP